MIFSLPVSGSSFKFTFHTFLGQDQVVFSESDPFTGTDLDNCVAKDGTIAPWAKEIITSLSSYTEYSPSKLGVHILTRATLSGTGKKVGSIEQYAQGRFFTLTTDHVPGTPTTIED